MDLAITQVDTCHRQHGGCSGGIMVCVGGYYGERRCRCEEERAIKQKYSLWLLGRYASPKVSQPNNAKKESCRCGLCVI